MTGRLTGREFEKILVKRHEEYFKHKMGCFSRYGVQAVQTGTDRGLVAIQSLPDFEGIRVDNPVHIIFDAKVCSQASFALAEYRGEPKKGSKFRQLKHMRQRSMFGAQCFFLIHWNERKLPTKYEPPETFIFPVSDSEFWLGVDAAETRSIKRVDCEDYGCRV